MNDIKREYAQKMRRMELMMNKESYVKSVVKKLECTAAQKKQIYKELCANIESEKSQGESWDSIEKRMGTPQEAAGEFNENFSEEERKKARREKKIRMISIITGIFLLVVLLLVLITPKTIPIEKSKIFQQDQLVDNAKQIITLFENEDYTTMMEEYGADVLKKSITTQQLDEAKGKIASEWGENIGFGNGYCVEISQLGNHYAVVQISASYENTSVSYTLSFDRNGKLSGFFLK